MKRKNFLIAIILTLSLFLSACGGGMSTANEAPASSASAAGEGSQVIIRGEAPGDALMPSSDGAFREDSADGEAYLTIDENRARSVEQESLLTFSLKVDTAAYTNVARYIESGNLPPGTLSAPRS